MSKKNTAQRRSEKLEAKKAEILRNTKKGRLPILVLVAAMLLISGGAAAYFTIIAPGSPGESAIASSPQQQIATEVSYPVSFFDDGQARHFEHTDGDVTVRYFVLKSSDGVIRAAFDACDVCWPAGKGYYQEGDAMVCRNCGRRFASVLVNEVKGGCNPAPLNRSVDGERLVIQVKDILDGRSYFNFAGKA